MKKPERLIGFVTIEGTDYPFEFDENNFTLNLYPPSQEIQDEKRFRFFQTLNDTKDASNEWIPSKHITGVSCGGNRTVGGSLFSTTDYHIMLDVQDEEINYNGFISYKVNWYFLYSEKIRQFGISGFKLSGSIINYFYNPEVALHRKVAYSEDISTPDLSVSSADIQQCSGDCGEYSLTSDIVVKMSVDAYATIHYQTASNPIDATSVFTAMFSRVLQEDEIETLINAYRYTRLFFHYLSYRSNIGLYTADVCFVDDKNRRDYCGLLVFKELENEESHKKASKRIIDYSVIGVHSSELFPLIASNAFGYNRTCKSLDDTNHYTSSRVIMILAEFEREFLNIYGRDCNRSQTYQDVKQEVLCKIDEIVSASTGKRRSVAKEIRKYVSRHSNSFESNVIKALTDCQQIMEPFVRKKYRIEFESAIEGIGKRMGEMRNALAHSKLSLQFEAIHLSDLKIVEELIYAMRLKIILNDVTLVQKAVNNLFGENFAI